MHAHSYGSHFGQSQSPAVRATAHGHSLVSGAVRAQVAAEAKAAEEAEAAALGPALDDIGQVRAELPVHRATQAINAYLNRAPTAPRETGGLDL